MQIATFAIRAIRKLNRIYLLRRWHKEAMDAAAWHDVSRAKFALECIRMLSE